MKKNHFCQKLNLSFYSDSYYFYIFPDKENDNILMVIKEKKAEQIISVTKDTDIADDNIYFKKQVKKPGLFFCIDNSDEWRDVEVFVRRVLQDFPVLKVLVFFTGGKMDSKPVAAHLLVTDKKDFNLLGKEKPVLKSWLQEHHFDLLMVMARKDNKRCNKLTAAIKANLKAGLSTNAEVPQVDFSLGKSGGKIDYDAFYSELKKYFKQMNIKLLP